MLKTRHHKESRDRFSFSNRTFKRIFSLSIPVILGHLAHFILNFSDRYFIALLGVDEAAGASLTTSLMWIYFSFSAVVSGGTIAIVSRKTGEKNKKEAGLASEQSLFIAIFIGMISSVLFFIFSPMIIGFFKAKPSVSQFGLEYYRVIICCFPMIILSQTIWAIFQSVGNTRTPMIIFSGMSLLNLVLDPFLIFRSFGIFSLQLHGLGFGVKGAALATVLAETVACVLMFIVLYRFREIQLKPFWQIVPDKEMIIRILKIGFWRGLNSFSRPLSVSFIQRILAFHGTNALAAFIFGLQWISIIFLFYEGLRVAVSTLVGQNLGRKDIAEAERTIYSGAVLGYIMIVFFLFMGYLFGEEAIRLFSEDPEIIFLGKTYLQIVLIGMIFSVPMNIHCAAFHGAGDTMPPMIISFLANWPGKVGMAAIGSFYFGLDATIVWVAISVSIIIEGGGIYLWFRRGNWKNKIV